MLARISGAGHRRPEGRGTSSAGGPRDIIGLRAAGHRRPEGAPALRAGLTSFRVERMRVLANACPAKAPRGDLHGHGLVRHGEKGREPGREREDRGMDCYTHVLASFPRYRHYREDTVREQHRADRTGLRAHRPVGVAADEADLACPTIEPNLPGKCPANRDWAPLGKMRRRRAAAPGVKFISRRSTSAMLVLRGRCVRPAIAAT
jgi:hypothetical protein